MVRIEEVTVFHFCYGAISADGEMVSVAIVPGEDIADTLTEVFGRPWDAINDPSDQAHLRERTRPGDEKILACVLEALRKEPYCEVTITKPAGMGDRWVHARIGNKPVGAACVWDDGEITIREGYVFEDVRLKPGV